MLLEVTVQPAPMTINRTSGRHWSVRAREKKRISKEVYCQVLRAPKLRFPVTLELERTGWNRCDEAGVVESAKPVIDALVEHGVLPDDSPKYVQSPFIVRQEIVRTKPPVSQLVVRLREKR